ncbi:recombinase family protein [Sphingomonas yabuuchiae]|uniref:DNA invertase Pin-like site-specific DNA recombinase n=1 Tax=Sphingomonas yabuuchiae TaxID=172044 RepID=A0AA41DE77_9SPHN|nr:recombinase family protein [Sphingomonas yabuuchiae]MBB4611546.1 DNA invertase Pin-like site-specific DNA recombinase [Sphingomonas yabuuchiae]MBN3556750.1 recombinase family protein [Sphingomonas yabuuchiae]
MIVGYARVSTDDQKVDLQIRALKIAGCERIFVDKGRSGCNFDRDGLEAALENLSPGGTLIVWRLDRLGRSLTGLVTLIDQLGKRDVHFKSIMENIDTTSSGGRLMFHMMAALAEFERALISERTRAGIAEARARGQKIGRPSALTPSDINDAQRAFAQSDMTMAAIALQLGVSDRTLRRHLNRSPDSPAVPGKPSGTYFSTSSLCGRYRRLNKRSSD